MSVEHLILLRHGQTDWNAGLRLQGQTDVPLNEVGLAQAKAAAASVAALEPDAIYSSDLMRARQTAEPVAALCEVPVTTDQRLRETHLGKWEGKTRDEVEADWPGQWDQWRASAADFTPPGGESRRQVARRGAELVDELLDGQARRALLVAHGGLIVGLTGQLLALPTDHWTVLTGITNCHWVLLHRTAIGWRLQSYNAGLGSVVLPNGEDEVAGV